MKNLKSLNGQALQNITADIESINHHDSVSSMEGDYQGKDPHNRGEIKLIAHDTELESLN